MRLSRRTILLEIQEGRLCFTLPVEPEQIDVSSVDLRLGTTFIFLDKVVEEHEKAGGQISWYVDTPWEPFREKYGQNTAEVQIGGELRLPPGKLVLGYTLEYITLPPALAGRVEGKSGAARRGLLIHLTAPTIQAGYHGQLQLEMYNVGPATLVLKPGQRICQLVLEQVTSPEQYEGQFQGQTTDS